MIVNENTKHEDDDDKSDLLVCGPKSVTAQMCFNDFPLWSQLFPAIVLVLEIKKNEQNNKTESNKNNNKDSNIKGYTNTPEVLMISKCRGGGGSRMTWLLGTDNALV